MNLETAKSMAIFRCVAGSHAYGTQTPESDVDERGIFRLPISAFLGLDDPVKQVEDKKHDVTYWELRRYFDLARNCNPNIIEVLWTPEDCVLQTSEPMRHILVNREMFISQKAYHTFSGYAYSQIKRAKGQNKWVNWGADIAEALRKARYLAREGWVEERMMERAFGGLVMDELRADMGDVASATLDEWVSIRATLTPPDKLDFCWYVDVEDVGVTLAEVDEGRLDDWPDDRMPCRPVPLVSSVDDDGRWREVQYAIDLSVYHAAKMERMENVYRLYNFYGNSPKGVFRGPNQQLVVESIPISEEWLRFGGLLIYNEDAYERAASDWKNYWKWRRDRNEARYRTQEAGEIDYDAKNLLHCMRLLWSGLNILRYGEPIVRFEGEKLLVLKDIRAGKYEYDDLMGMVEAERAALDRERERTSIPYSVDEDAIDRLYREVCEIGEAQALRGGQ